MLMTKAKPFIKWVGGKGQLLAQLDELLPADLFRSCRDITYVEPFVGGGAMLFHMLRSYPAISKAVINDINADLITCYRTVRDETDALVSALRQLQADYLALPDELRKEFFLAVRDKYNAKESEAVETTTMFFFLNRTCFNGLYRVNRKGAFNVPFGRYPNPLICDEQTLRADAELLRRVEVMSVGEFDQTASFASPNAFFYFDPPYRPLDATSSFTSYSKESFNDDDQVRLKSFCDRVSDAGALFMLSNSDCRAKNPDDTFFDDLYGDYRIDRVLASRNVNSVGSKRGKLSEIVVHNYDSVKGGNPTLF